MADQPQGAPPQRPGDHGYRWVAAVLVTTLPLLFALTRELSETPFPINETVAFLYDAKAMGDTDTSAHTLLDPTFVTFFDPSHRSWYRPLFWTTWYGFWHATHSLDTTLLLFRLLEVLTTLLLVVGFIMLLKPGTFLDYASACAAVSVLVGMPGFRENLELPLLMTLVGMLFAVIAWALLERPHRTWHGPLLVLLVVLAVGYKEQGLVLVPVIVAAWWVGAPGARRGTAAAIAILTAAYLVMRFSTAGSWRPFEQDVGLGFHTIGASDAAERFGSFPYWMYAYNVAATVANVLFSEPTDGTFRFVEGVLEDGPAPWALNHVLSSTVTTVVLVWWAVRTWRRAPPGPRAPESRLVVALVLAVAASGALGFNYSRDRLGGMAVVFYALASYYAFREMGARVRQLRGGSALVAAALALLLSTGWQLRAIGTVDSVHERAVGNHRHWIAGRKEIRLTHGEEALYMRIFEAMAPQGLAPIRERPARADWVEDLIGPR
jgi:hypothetical protein